MRLQVVAAKVSWLPLLTALCLATGARAQTPCVAPEVPASPFNGSTQAKHPTLPVKPPCMDEPKGLKAQKVGENTCTDEIVEKYNRQIRAYNAAIDVYASNRHDYAVSLQEYVNKAVAYGQCELDAIRN